jgi:hypothetical protein
MNFTLVAFNYQSDYLEAEEHNYLGHHVALVKTLPGLRQYYTARTMEHRGEKPSHFRHALLAFDNAPAAPAIGAEIAADTRAHLKDLRSLVFDGEIIPRRRRNVTASITPASRDGCRGCATI